MSLYPYVPPKCTGFVFLFPCIWTFCKSRKLTLGRSGKAEILLSRKELSKYGPRLALFWYFFLIPQSTGVPAFVSCQNFPPEERTTTSDARTPRECAQHRVPPASSSVPEEKTAHNGTAPPGQKHKGRIVKLLSKTDSGHSVVHFKEGTKSGDNSSSSVGSPCGGDESSSERRKSETTSRGQGTEGGSFLKVEKARVRFPKFRSRPFPGLEGVDFENHAITC